MTPKRRTLGYLLAAWALLLIIPVILLSTNTLLLGVISLDSLPAQAFYWITSSGTAPYGIITTLVVLLISFFRLPTTQFIALFLSVSLALGMAMGLNRFLKPLIKEPRPNVHLLANHGFLNVNHFYQLDKKARKKAMKVAIDKLIHSDNHFAITDRIKHHWQHEVNFSFPSGHTIFAITLSLTTGYFLLLTGSYLLSSLLFLWSLAVGFSRMLLGMHWAQDVFASTAIGGIISLFSLWLILKYQQRFLSQRASNAIS